jgi:ribonucleoside-triphosphate reductase
VLHLYLGERLYDTEVCKSLIKKIFTNYKLPYISITPTFSICNTHGYIAGEHFTCPECGGDTEVWSRVVGYLRPVDQWNAGKQEEFKGRKTFDSAVI